MGWTPETYYNATFREYYLAQQGYWEADKRQQHYLRRTAYIVHCSMVEKPLTPFQLWPIAGEAEQQMAEAESFRERMLRITAEEVERMKNEENAKALAQDGELSRLEV